MDALYKKIMAIRRPVVFRASRLLYGWVHTGIPKDPIYINLAQHGIQDPTETYAHECLHVLFPDKTEEEIVSLTDKFWHSMTSHQRFLLSRKLFARQWRTE